MTASALFERLAALPGRFPGTLLISGDSERWLEEQARRFAARILCAGDDPAGSCDSCRRALAGLHPDLLVVEPEGVQIRVDRVREALLFAAGRPYESQRRVALVLRADLLGLESGNALLKTLEEPGQYLHWILTTSRPETLLPTIRSRCCWAVLPGVSRAERAHSWRDRGFDESDAADLASASFGPDQDADASTLLEDYRARRVRIVEALTQGLSHRRLAALVLLADELARAEAGDVRLAAELLADAALGTDPPPGTLRHPAVAGALRGIAERIPADALRLATLKAVDCPADSRKGNKRLHWEALLLELYDRSSSPLPPPGK